MCAHSFDSLLEQVLNMFSNDIWYEVHTAVVIYVGLKKHQLTRFNRRAILQKQM